jgi:hypothetical protein
MNCFCFPPRAYALGGVIGFPNLLDCIQNMHG